MPICRPESRGSDPRFSQGPHRRFRRHETLRFARGDKRLLAVAVFACSLLAAPHDAAMRDRLNRDIKYREEFRPFAPVTPIEAADRYFELPPGGARLARFMSGVFPVRPEWRARLAAITHVDGSARLQTLECDTAPRLYALLEAYGRRSGIPVLLNTSFNVAGEPIVTRAIEGYSTFRRCGIDALVAGPTLVTKRASSPARSLKEEVA